MSSVLSLQKGFFVLPDADLMQFPLAGECAVLQTVTGNGRTAGHIYVYMGTSLGWVDVQALDGVGTGASILQTAPAFLTSFGLLGASGQRLDVKMLTELTTIAAAATTDTTIEMPAGAIILAVPVRVTVVIPTATTFTVGDSGSAARFNTGSNVAVAAGTTDKGTKAGAYYNASALPITITPDGTPGAATGRVRVSIFYIEVTALTA